MAITFGDIAGQEPSTVSFRVETAVIDRNGTNVNREILVFGDPETSNAVARVVAAAPDSTHFGAVVRQVGYSTVVSVSTGSVRVHQSTAADLNVTVAGYVAPSTVVSVSTGSVRVHQSTAADLNVTVAGYSTVVSVSTGSVRVHQSTAADLNVTVAGYSTTVNVSSLAGAVIVRSSAANALMTAYQSTAADLQATVTPASTTWQVQANGMVAHGTAVGGNPLQVAGGAVAHGANPSAVAAGAVTRFTANRAGIQFVIGGHPNVITTEYLWTTAQTDDVIVAVSSGTRLVVTQAQVAIDEASTASVGFRIGFSSGTLPTAPTDGNAVAGYVLSHGGLVPGAGWTRGDGSGILGIGGDDEDLRITAEAPGGRAVISYYSIES